jgi:hypothetical protein
MALPLVPGNTGPMVTQMQNAIIGKGFSVGPAGANGTFNEDTLVETGGVPGQQRATGSTQMRSAVLDRAGLARSPAIRGDR